MTHSLKRHIKRSVKLAVKRSKQGMKCRFAFIALISCLLLTSCGLFHGRHSGGHGNVNVRGGGNGPAALIILGVGVAIGTIISAIPDKHTPISSGRYYADGIFYRDTSQGYEVISAPMGVWVNDIPAQHRLSRFQNRDYIECRGVWYRYSENTQQYQVIKNPYK
ncbi:DUF6515 family protein [Paraglaciecola sp. T6c]|uniref:DUF6515 family protein n=1 Tax=Pseudoalteromonas atlantica (strain T6c / ATCC BAA-1087) TaxID=3042615 RepID=UPI001E42CD0B|nr:DUF6515 family protein [Paraglaciecola sp. T6c]